MCVRACVCEVRPRNSRPLRQKQCCASRAHLADVVPIQVRVECGHLHLEYLPTALQCIHSGPLAPVQIGTTEDWCQQHPRKRELVLDGLLAGCAALQHGAVRRRASAAYA